MKRKDVQTLGSVIKEYLKESRLDGKLAEVEVVDAWPEIMGKIVARATKDVYYKNGTLFVKLKSSIVRNELFMMRQDIIKGMNKHVGVEIVKNIVLQ
jgi:predicted nucleic acid-binding Zn ribbon protein